MFAKVNRYYQLPANINIFYVLNILHKNAFQSIINT